MKTLRKKDLFLAKLGLPSEENNYKKRLHQSQSMMGLKTLRNSWVAELHYKHQWIIRKIKKRELINIKKPELEAGYRKPGKNTYRLDIDEIALACCADSRQYVGGILLFPEDLPGLASIIASHSIYRCFKFAGTDDLQQGLKSFPGKSGVRDYQIIALGYYWNKI
jgi:hypothetical protein